MSKEVNPFVAILEGNEPIKKQPYGSNIEYYDSMCFHLLRALINRSFNEEEGKRLVAFLESLHYDFQYCNTVRGIFTRKNNREIDQKWVNVLLENNYCWEQLKNIHDRIGICSRKRTWKAILHRIGICSRKNVWKDLLHVLVPKRKKG